jgi:tetratricopeptide (TPR) repeat protein
MGFVTTGKIREETGLREPLAVVCAATQVKQGVLRILSKDVSGRMSITEGRYITGAQVQATNSTGYGAIKELLCVSKGMYAFFEPEDQSEFSELHQGLAVPLSALVDADPVAVLEQIIASLDGAQGGIGNAAGAPMYQAPQPLAQPSQPPPGASSSPAAKPLSLNAAVPKSPAQSPPPAPVQEPNETPPSIFGKVVNQMDSLARRTMSGIKRLSSFDSSNSGSAEAAQVFNDLDKVLAQASQPKTEPTPHPQTATPAIPQRPSGHQPAYQPPPPPPPPPPPTRPSATIPAYQQPPPPPPPPPPRPSGAQPAYEQPPRPSAGEPIFQQAAMPGAPSQPWPDTPQEKRPLQPPEDPFKNTPSYDATTQPTTAPAQPDSNILKRTAQKIVSRIAQAQARQESNENLQDRMSKSQRLRTVELEALADTGADAKQKVGFLKDKATQMGLLVSGVVIGGIIFCLFLGSSNGPEQNLLQGEKYLQHDKPDLAISELTMVISQRPNDVKALFLRADAYERIEDWRSAEADYEQLAKVNSKAPQAAASVKRGMLLYRLKRFDDALGMANEFLKTHPGDKAATTLKGMSLARTGKYQDAVAALNSPPPDMVAAADLDLAFALYNLKQYPQSVEAYTRTVNADPQLAQARREKALAEIGADRLKDATFDLRAACDMDPKSGDCYQLLGDIYARTNQDEKALQAYNSAVMLNYELPTCYLGMARCQMQLKLFNEATTTIDKLMAIAPDNAEGKKLSEQLHSMAKSVVSDEHGHKQTVDIVSADMETLLKAGSSALRQGKAGQAVEYLNAAVRKGAHGPEPRLMLARAFIKAGETKQAYEEFQEVDKMAPLSDEDRLSSAKCAIAAGLKEDGVKILKACLVQRANWVEARVLLIQTYLAMGMKDQAKAVSDAGLASSTSAYEKGMYTSALTK